MENVIISINFTLNMDFLGQSPSNLQNVYQNMKLKTKSLIKIIKYNRGTRNKKLPKSCIL